jgi:hypothetical protein
MTDRQVRTVTSLIKVNQSDWIGAALFPPALSVCKSPQGGAACNVDGGSL